jgi:hypothetical protein
VLCVVKSTAETVFSSRNRQGTSVPEPTTKMSDRGRHRLQSTVRDVAYVWPCVLGEQQYREEDMCHMNSSDLKILQLGADEVTTTSWEELVKILYRVMSLPYG